MPPVDRGRFQAGSLIFISKQQQIICRKKKGGKKNVPGISEVFPDAVFLHVPYCNRACGRPGHRLRTLVPLKRVKDENKKHGTPSISAAKGEFDEARELVNKDTSAMAEMLGWTLRATVRSDGVKTSEIAMEESMMEIIPHT